MRFTARFAHLSDTPLAVGDTLVYGKRIGTMGNSGSEKTGIHLHLDVTEGENKIRFNLADMMKGRPRPNKRQLDYFLDRDLFKTELVITTLYLDPEYRDLFKKDHPAYDLVPADRHKTREHYDIYWNRSRVGTVIRIDQNDPGYGRCVYISFDAEE